MITGSIEQQDLMVVITPVPNYQVQILPSNSSWFSFQIPSSEDQVHIAPSENQTRVTVAPIDVVAVNNLSSYISRAQFSDRADYADISGKVVFTHASGSIVYTGSVSEGIFGVSETVYSVPTSSYSAALVEYVAERSNSIRVGQVMATWLNGTIKFM